MDLILVIILTAILVPAVLFTSGPLRIALGLPFVLFFPGYTLVTALFPRKGNFDAIERIALSLGLSLAIVSVIGLILNYTSWGIRPTPVLISLTFFVVITSAFTLYRRGILPQAQSFKPKLRLKFANWIGQNKLDKALSLILTLSIIGTIGLMAYVIVTPKVGERFSEFYILGPGAMAGDYPRQLTLGEQGEVILGILNQEYQESTYFVEIRIDGDKVQEIGPISLAFEEKWELATAFTPQKAGEDQRVDFLLFKDEKSQPYHRLQIWIDVKGSE